MITYFFDQLLMSESAWDNTVNKFNVFLNFNLNVFFLHLYPVVYQSFWRLYRT